MILTAGDGETVLVMREGQQHILRATASLDIPALCVGVIRHDLYLDKEGGICLLSPDPLALTTRALLVQGGVIDSGEVLTPVFNLSNQLIKIRKGDTVSRLIAI